MSGAETCFAVDDDGVATDARGLSFDLPLKLTASPYVWTLIFRLASKAHGFTICIGFHL